MATGSLTVSITIPVTNANAPDNVGRQIAKQLLAQAEQAVSAGPATSGNLTYPAPATIAGTWTYTAPT